METALAYLVELDPTLQYVISIVVTAAVSFLLLQLASVYPPLAEYLGQYKVGIVTWLTGVVVQLLQAQLDKIPPTWEGVALIAMKLIAEVALVLLGFSGLRKIRAKGHRALLPS